MSGCCDKGGGSSLGSGPDGGSGAYRIAGSNGWNPGGGGGGGGAIAPDAVPDLYLWWDGFDGATYGATGFTSFVDKGPNGLNGVPAAGDIVPPTPYDFNGSPVDLPGPFALASPSRFPSVSDAKLWGDFSAVFFIPTSLTQPTSSSLMALFGSSPFFLFNVFQSGVLGSLSIQVNGGGTALIPLGFGAGLQGHAVLVCRNTVGGSLVVDGWYDDNSGSGIQRPPTVTVAGAAAALSITSIHFGGRGSLTQTWRNNPLHSMALYDRVITNDEAVGLAKFAGDRTGWNPADISY